MSKFTRNKNQVHGEHPVLSYSTLAEGKLQIGHELSSYDLSLESSQLTTKQESTVLNVDFVLISAKLPVLMSGYSRFLSYVVKQT